MLILDQDQEDKLQGYVISYNTWTRTALCHNNEKDRKGRLLMRSVSTVLYNYNSKTHALYHENGNYKDFRKSQCEIMTQSEHKRMFPPYTNRKYKGVVKRRLGYETVIQYNKTSKVVTYLDSNHTEEQCASIYDACLDYLEWRGWRNNTPQIELTEEIKIKLEEIKKETK